MGKRNKKLGTPAFLGFVMYPSDKGLIELMPPTYQEALRATGSYADRAAKLNMPQGTIRSRLNRARERLVKLRAAAEVSP